MPVTSNPSESSPAPKKLGILQRKYLVNPGFQWEMVGFFVGTYSILLAVLYVGFYKIDRRTLEQLQAHGIPIEHPAYVLVSGQEIGAAWIFLLDAALALLFVGLGAFLISFRIAGPLYRLRLEIRKMVAGERVDKIRFRKNDYFQDIAEAVSELNERNSRADRG